MSDMDMSAMAPGSSASSGMDPTRNRGGMTDMSPNAPAAPLTGVRGRAPEVVDVGDYDNTGLGAFLHGAADTITFGFLDEAGAFVDSTLPEWMGGTGETYDQALARNRAILRRYEEDHSGSYMGGQVAGGFVPLFGWAGRGKAAVQAVRAGRTAQIGRMAAEGAAYGALYGAGSADGDLGDRLGNAAYMGVLGGAGGFVLGTTILRGGALVADGARRAAVAIRNGRAPRLDVKWKAPVNVADDVAEDLGSIAASEARSGANRASSGARRAATETTTTSTRPMVNRLTGRLANEMEDGAIATGEELLNPAMRETLLERVTKLTPQQARMYAQSLSKAMETGNLTKDPHFRSLLGLDLSGLEDDGVDAAVHASEMLTEMAQEILERAGMGRKTVKGMEQQLRRQFADGFEEAHLDDLLQRTQEVSGYANVGRTVQMLAGLEFTRVTKDLLPKVMKGDGAAREELANALSAALRKSAKGQALMSHAGQTLGMLSHQGKMLFKEVGENVKMASPSEVRERVQKAFDELGDNGLNELLNRVRDLTDLEEVSRVLLDPERAKQVGTWTRFKNTFEAYIKSNTLTVATGIVNMVSVPIHYTMRRPLARMMAAQALRWEGKTREALIHKLANDAGNSVRWQAYLEGAKAAARRIKWEALTDAERIFGVAGARRIALKASGSRQAMIGRGYRPPQIREFDQKARLAVTDLDGFEKRLAERAASGAPLARLVNGLERAGAAGLNTLDAVGTGMAKLASGAIDDGGRAMIGMRELYATSAQRATQEALERGVPDDDIVNWVSKRTQELVDKLDEEVLGEVEQKILAGDKLDETDIFMINRSNNLDKEADRVMFLDGPQTGAGRTAERAAGFLDTAFGGGVFKGILFPYKGTPVRILETGLASYTPWGHKTQEVAEILAKGGPEAALERARMEIGGMIIGIGMMAGATGAVTVTNGGWKNSANLTGAPPNRINTPGGGYVEMGRLDPVASTVAMGAIIGQMQMAAREAEDDFGQGEALKAAFTTAYMAIRDGILEKSYMTGARELMEALSNTPEQGAEYFTRSYADAITRVLPMSGTARQINETIHGDAIEAVGFMDRLAKVTPGMAGYLPTRVDALGNDVEGRFMGFGIGTTSNTDPLTMRIAELGVDITNLRRADPAGFDLTSEELSELRRIRATEALNPDGYTMREALSSLLDSTSFQRLPTKQQQQDAIVETMSKFNQDAREIFEVRNQDYLSNREANRSLSEYIDLGVDPLSARRMAEDEVTAAGLPTPDRLRDY